ncbi:11510_t:CDS:2 [Acaulospora morrowiae]|uniref:Poly [ADP-ribose] polymerase n=1 Tax=Acaulospora morrowiae TaxID=94023 RepID=A0A9N9A9B4_9GLOM|nr:11510_t:CDS:2 [Acaulospora morrowiae]
MSGSKKEYQLEDGKLILDRVRSYFVVPLANPPKDVVLSRDDSLYKDIAVYFEESLKQAGCRIVSISVLQNRQVWERYHQFKSLQQAIEQEERAAKNLQNTFFETAFKDTVLFHGTQPDNVTSILDHGLDGRFSKSYGNCGPGIYLSPSFEKCDLFASRYSPSQRSLVVCVTALGKIYDNTITQTVSPHTKYPPKGYNSVKHFVSVSDEYVVYENSQVLPILAVTYEKIEKNIPRPITSSFILPPPPFPVVSSFTASTPQIITSGHNVKLAMGSAPKFTTLNNNTCNFGPLVLTNLSTIPPPTFHQRPSFSRFPFLQHLSPSKSLSGNSHTESNWCMRKAHQMLNQWEAQVNFNQDLSNIYGALMADRQFWPQQSGGSYPNLGSYLNFALSSQRNKTLINLDQGLVNMLKTLNSYQGIVHAKRQQVEANRSVNLQQVLTTVSQKRLQEAISSQESCTICAELLLTFASNKDIVQMNNCPHLFHQSCIGTWLSMPSSQMVCPNCKTPCHDPMAPPPIGPMPDGEMAYIFSEHLGAWFICYGIPNGTQLPCHLTPGRPFKGTTRTAVCPIYFKWGPLLFIRLVAAFYYHHTFTVGTSLTTNMSDTIVWNGIHHKTSIDGGFGFPDSTYEERVSLELDAKGVLLFLRDVVSNG